jgi:hypothetical protein
MDVSSSPSSFPNRKMNRTRCPVSTFGREYSGYFCKCYERYVLLLIRGRAVVSREQSGMGLFVTVREMEERPSGAGFQDQASNRLTLLWSKAMVVNV